MNIKYNLLSITLSISTLQQWYPRLSNTQHRVPESSLTGQRFHPGHFRRRFFCRLRLHAGHGDAQEKTFSCRRGKWTSALQVDFFASWTMAILGIDFLRAVDPAAGKLVQDGTGLTLSTPFPVGRQLRLSCPPAVPGSLGQAAVSCS